VIVIDLGELNVQTDEQSHLTTDSDDLSSSVCSLVFCLEFNQSVQIYNVQHILSSVRSHGKMMSLETDFAVTLDRIGTG